MSDEVNPYCEHCGCCSETDCCGYGCEQCNPLDIHPTLACLVRGDLKVVNPKPNGKITQLICQEILNLRQELDHLSSVVANYTYKHPEANE